MRNEMTPEEDDYLFAYWQLFGFGESKQDLRAALVASSFAGEFEAFYGALGREIE